jgi:hypothetical protein
VDTQTLFGIVVFAVVVVVGVVLVVRSRSLRERDFGSWHIAYRASTESPETDPVRLKELWSAELHAQAEARREHTPATAPATAVGTSGSPFSPTAGTNPHNTLAIVSFIFSLLGGLLGIVFGYVALAQIRRTGEDGRGLAIAGIVLGYRWIAGSIAFLVLAYVISARNGFL